MDICQEDFDKLADELGGWTGSDINNLCREAALVALRENIDSQKVMSLSRECAYCNIRLIKSQVVYAHLEQAKQACRPTFLR